MTVEVLLLCSLIFVFILSFCGLLQKIRQTYYQERLLAGRLTQPGSTNRDGNSDAYVNTTFVEDSSVFDRHLGVFPTAPPPYSPIEEPPKYEDIIKAEQNDTRTVPTALPHTLRTADTQITYAPTQPPPPYTIST